MTVPIGNSQERSSLNDRGPGDEDEYFETTT